MSKPLCIAAALTGIALLTACGTDDSNPDLAAVAPSFVFESGTETPGMTGGMPMDMPGMPGMSMADTAIPAAPAGPNVVDITDFAFAPATLTVPVGTTVTWTNRDEEPHTVASTDGAFHSPGMGAGATYSFTFTTAGDFAYICSIHPFMRATVVVTP